MNSKDHFSMNPSMEVPAMMTISIRSAILAGLLLVGGSTGLAGQDAMTIPLERVVLFHSGVGFYEHAGSVRDDTNISMRFNTRDINDLLKSMVVRDLDGGQVDAVRYPSRDPITKTLRTFAIDLTADPSLAELLAQVRGERVEVEMPARISGIILGVETRRKRIGDNEFMDVDILNLLTDNGLQSVALDSVSSIRLLNEALQAELDMALSLLASAHATDKKTVTVQFTGQGERRVRVGYIQESPVWKTSYRLVLAGEETLLQGWAIVENTSEQDWRGVDLTLVSGRPVSFTMDLYEPLYLPRPEVQFELFTSVLPQTYGQDLSRLGQVFADEHAADRMAESQVMPMMAPSPAVGSGQPGTVADIRRRTLKDLSMSRPESMDLRRGVQSVAEGIDAGESFQYRIQAPVNLPRQQSAMLPIVNSEITGEKLAIYNWSVHAKHPLSGLRFTNTTDLHLMQGPITVFDGGVYAGDARIEDIPPGGERLISYAMDLDTEVVRQGKSTPEELRSVRIVKGTLHAERKFLRSQEYVIRNSGRTARTVLIEQPIEAQWTLVKPSEPAEKTRDFYRFAVRAEPGKPAGLLVEEERIDTQHILLTNIDDALIHLYMKATVVSEQVREALGEVVAQRHQIERVAGQRRQYEQEIRGIEQDQARMRQNMAQLDRQSEVYRGYVRKFSEQETQLEKLRREIADLHRQEQDLRQVLDEYLMNLELS
ncbi:hypothetical protein [Desulfobulbus alkaliphilus]|uniref:hypothetical protein n=1 Tax=Desulfobulbus alkaliphilus TaxID=869814 RepID=UPI00196388BB|nr:hypothetical protein [Desulfobulbus alkaliphilus]MBM9536251.1 hypothetical protein [Desulfobulbus alkaliphilus]